MTEAEWRTCEDPKLLTDFLFARATPRKLRLWACACGREVLTLYPKSPIGDILDQFEEVAEGSRARDEMQRALSELQARPRRRPGFHRAVAGIVHSQWIEMTKGYEGHFALGLLHLAYAKAEHSCPKARWVGFTDPPTDPQWLAVYSYARQRHSELARDIIGNPFHPVGADPLWRTATAAALARQMYESRDFSAMPILADALQDAGCDHEEILAHCRGRAPHVRGCWVVDLLLLKS